MCVCLFVGLVELLLHYILRELEREMKAKDIRPRRHCSGRYAHFGRGLDPGKYRFFLHVDLLRVENVSETLVAVPSDFHTTTIWEALVIAHFGGGFMMS